MRRWGAGLYEPPRFSHATNHAPARRSHTRDITPTSRHAPARPAPPSMTERHALEATDLMQWVDHAGWPWLGGRGVVGRAAAGRWLRCAVLALAGRAAWPAAGACGSRGMHGRVEYWASLPLAWAATQAHRRRQPASANSASPTDSRPGGCPHTPVAALVADSSSSLSSSEEHSVPLSLSRKVGSTCKDLGVGWWGELGPPTRPPHKKRRAGMRRRCAGEPCRMCAALHPPSVPCQKRRRPKPEAGRWAACPARCSARPPAGARCCSRCAPPNAPPPVPPGSPAAPTTHATRQSRCTTTRVHGSSPIAT